MKEERQGPKKTRHFLTMPKKPLCAQLPPVLYLLGSEPTWKYVASG